MKKISITTSSFAVESKEPLELLQQAGFEVQLNPFSRKLTRDETVSFLGASAGVIAGTEEYSKDVLARLPSLRVISRCGAGTDGIDKEYLKDAQIELLSTPEVHIDAVAELTIAGLLSVTRKIAESHRLMHDGKWEKIMGVNLSSKSVGLVGFGKVGRKVAQLLTGFSCRILTFDPFVKDSVPDNVNKVDKLETLLSKCDVISLHMPGASGRAIISAEQFALMKNDVILVNTSRGGLIDESALAEFLKQNANAGAYLDVFEKEPYRGELARLPNIVATPHVGTFTRETRVRMEIESVNNIIHYFSTHG